MIRETLPLADTPFVELIAVMPKYSPFAEKAGMRRVGVQVSVKYVSKISSVLLEWGFDMQFLGSERYVTNKLEGLSPAELGMLREVFRCNRHPRFRKEFGGVGCRQIFFTRVDWEVAIGVADLVKFAKLIRVVGVLLQKFTCFGLVPIDYVASFFLFCAKKPFFEPLSDASINFVNISYFVAARSSRLGFLRLLFRSTKTASSLVDEACFSPVKWLG